MAIHVAFFFLLASLLKAVSSTTFNFTNYCPHAVWPATLAGASSPPLSTTGFQLAASASFSLHAPSNWSGRMWARTNCSTNDSGEFHCLTGDCGTGKLQCHGAGGIPPASLVEFTLNGADGKDFYDVSLVDGFNLPVAVAPSGGRPGCDGTTGCAADIKSLCPPELREPAATADGSVVGCNSACWVFGLDEYCCTGKYNDPDKCGPTKYSMVFKKACPLAYSYPYDDETSTFTCIGADYLITFCPSKIF
ncbi:thaumatin-like protein 1b [Dendrobium catenatum]|uniref:Thaumatin-like protein 1a n=1 Tax=Dendrobium catenatum TaxID=906689 RepID=A0A2I0VWZ0_9ASPA|nr:thaumatin-like protein 1b [Dendrobium catenatum]PKU67926.1 Thaumatin-like protein 1a [Dendrobium catenatum]